MTGTSDLVAAGITADPAAVKRSLGDPSAAQGPALGFAAAAVLMTAGVDFEARPWRRVCASRRNVAHALQRVARRQLATTALAALPPLAEEVLALPAVAAKVGNGPLARRPVQERARVVLRDLLLDSPWLLKKVFAGGLPVDADGGWLATAALTLLWRPTARHNPFPGPCVLRLQDDGRDLLEHAAAAAGAGPVARLLVHFGRASFFAPSARELSEAIAAFEAASTDAGADGLGDVALAGLLMTGLRARDRSVAERALSRVDSRLSGSAGPRTVLWRAWAALLGGDRTSATGLLAGASSLPTSLRGEAAELLRAAGASDDAATLIAGLSDDDTPGRHRLAAFDAVPTVPTPPTA